MKQSSFHWRHIYGLMSKSRENPRFAWNRAFSFEKRDRTRYRQRTKDPSIAFGTDVRRKKARKKGESIIKLAFYSARDRIERSRAQREAQGERAASEGAARGGARERETEYKVTSHVYFIPVDPIKVPIIISDVFRCNMFDLVSDILWSHICLVNLVAVAPLHKNIKRRCVPRSTPIPGGKILPAIPRDGNSLSCPAAW